MTGQTRSRIGIGSNDIHHRLGRFGRITGEACGIVTGGTIVQVLGGNSCPRRGQMAIGAQGTRCRLGKVSRLDDQGVSVTMTSEVGDMAGNTLATRGLADGAASQGTIGCAMARSTTRRRVGLAYPHKRRRGRDMASDTVDQGRRCCRIDLD